VVFVLCCVVCVCVCVRKESLAIVVEEVDYSSGVERRCDTHPPHKADERSIARVGEPR
jgi:hypothetical protein